MSNVPSIFRNATVPFAEVPKYIPTGAGYIRKILGFKEKFLGNTEESVTESVMIVVGIEVVVETIDISVHNHLRRYKTGQPRALGHGSASGSGQ